MLRFLISYRTVPVCIIILFSILGCDRLQTSSENLDAEKLFTFQVYPLLESRCFGCHGDDPKEIEGEFDIRSFKGMLKGGESGKPALIPGDAERSPIYYAATREDEDFAMPPKDNDKLSQGELDDLYNWVQAGAPWPSDKRRQELITAGGWDYSGKVPVSTSEALSESWANRKYNPAEIWAFYPLRKDHVPWEHLNNDSTQNPIDAFINKKLSEYQIKAAPKADKLTLIRRVTFDLIGLPPSPEEIAAFINDDSPDAYSKVIDRLLQSPHYGEQWARHWLDVVRYADSDGFSNDYVRPNAWRYRDYVIRSFNQDKPYDQFVVEQIAGDELDPQNPENLIATGFLRMGPWEHTSMSVKAETRQYFLDDVTNAVGETFLSQPLRCARCHDHKFDPIPTRDYYSVQAVFATTQFAERPAPFLEEENLHLLKEEKNRVLQLLSKAETEKQNITEKEEYYAKQWMQQHGFNYLPKNQRRKLPENQQPPRYHGLTHQDLGYRKLLSKRVQRYKRELEGFQVLAFSVYNGPLKVINSDRPFRVPELVESDPLQETFILTGGSVYAPADKVDPGVLSALPSLQDSLVLLDSELSLAREIANSKDLRRLDFARWIADKNNPMISRSIVNRIWQYHFGKGIAENSNNFGVTGKQPTHPELLDWLAADLVENGWSIKGLHKLIMTSQVYQRSSRHPDKQQVSQIDVNNKYLSWFEPRRLEAEEIRDAMLFASGELNTEIGGLPVRPEMHREQALQPRHVMGSIAPAYQPSPVPESRNRRSIYALKLRGLIDPMMEVFNQPMPDLSCERRTASSVTPQVFMLFNDKVVRDRAVAMAERVSNRTPDTGKQISMVIREILNRPAISQEIDRTMGYWNRMVEYHRENPFPEETYPTQVEREMFEEMTGEIFHFVEELEAYKNYTHDLKSWEVGPETRALADVCVVLFNSNEFIYVY
ncbi:MAG: hypothetical protein DHS20C17_32780 [Cyclobacteriaceae bacterium]|nr:MAG: hypothetical protein DHS20C17_32780 [Cyclobacteriaceae bacterium]